MCDDDLNVIPDERFHFLLSENAFGLTFINAGLYCVDIVESGNTFHYLSLHHQPAVKTTGHDTRS